MPDISAAAALPEKERGSCGEIEALTFGGSPNVSALAEAEGVARRVEEHAEGRPRLVVTVSYTHLTLPTSDLV